MFVALIVLLAFAPVASISAQAEKPHITIVYDSDVDHIELMQFRSVGAYHVTANLYEPLLTQTTIENRAGELIGQSEFEGALAESWEVSEDGTTFTFHLREDNTFADGTPLTAHDFKYTFDRAFTGPGYIGVLAPFMAVSSADAITVIDDYTLQIQTDQPAALVETVVGFQVLGAISQATSEEHATEDDPWAEEWYRANSNSSGAYSISEWTPGEEYVFEPNPNYWRGEDFFQNSGVTFRIVADAEERAQLLLDGEVDIALGLPFGELRDLARNPDLTVHAIPSTRLYHLGMNNNVAPFDDVRVRQAISMAIPYNALIENVLSGFGTQPTSPVSVGMEGHTSDFWTYGDADLDDAIALLEDAGLGDGFELELTIPAEDQTRIDAADWIQAGLSRIGIDVSINAVPTAEFSELINSHELPFFIQEWYSWGNDPFFQLTFNLQCGSFPNYVNYCNEEVDDLIAQGTFSRDDDEREDLIRRAQEIIVEDAPWAYLYQPDLVVVTRSNIEGIALFNDLTIRYAYLGIAE
jgi:peptide/nickel transport system substrate-binding protein